MNGRESDALRQKCAGKVLTTSSSGEGGEGDP